MTNTVNSCTRGSTTLEREDEEGGDTVGDADDDDPAVADDDPTDGADADGDLPSVEGATSAWCWCLSSTSLCRSAA